MAHLEVDAGADGAPARARPGTANVRRYDDRAPAATMFEAAAFADRPSTELLRLTLAASLSLLDVEMTLVCDADGVVIGVAPEDPATLEGARPFARAALRALDADELPDGLYIARLTEAPAAFIAARWRPGAPRRLDLAHALASTCASLLHRDESAYRGGDLASDGLTGLASRVPTLHQLERAIHAATRAGTRCGFLFIDLDGFKAVNDHFGHAAGDRTLAEAGRRMRGCVRRGDVVGRIGGDEFGVVVAMHDGETELLEAAERLLAALRLSAGDHGERRDVSASIGVAVFPEDGTTVQELLERADAAMYAAKRAGGNAVRFYRDGVLDDPRARRAIGTAFAEIDYERDLLLCFQPLLDVATLRVVAFEALLRWRHPTEGWLAPGAFQSEFAAADTAHAIDRWVIESTLATLQRLPAEGLRAHVNIALADERIVGLLAALPSADAARLAIEVSESSFIASPQAAGALFEGARAFGTQVGIDRFGASRVSLDALTGQPFDYVKIDRRLSREAATGERGMRLFRAAVDIVRRFDARPIAEGVERLEVAGSLAACGIDAMQGYALAQPMTAPDLGDWLRAGGAVTAAAW